MTVMTICWTISRCYLLVHIFLDYAAPLRPFLMGSCGSLTQRQQDESMKGWKMMEICLDIRCIDREIMIDMSVNYHDLTAASLES